MASIKNASPQVIHLGADDKSGRTVTPTSEPIPQHCPLFYIFAEKGPTDRLLLSASKLNTIYGTKTFSTSEKFYNHQTRGLLGISGQANSCMVKRLVPEDAGIKANRVMYIDVLETEIPNYQRDSYGKYIYSNETNTPIVNQTTPTIKGYVVKYIAETLDDVSNIKTLTPKTGQGTMSVTTTVTPVLDSYVRGQINGLRTKYNINETIDFDAVVTPKAFTVTSSNPEVVNYDGNKWVALKAGNSNLTVTFTATETEKESSITTVITVVETGAIDKLPEVTVSGVISALTPETTSFTVEVKKTEDDSEVADATVTAQLNQNVVTVPESSKTVTANENGTAYVNVFIPAAGDTDDNKTEGVSYGYAIESKVIEPQPVQTTVRSTLYPLLARVAKNQGKYYDNLGVAIAPITGTDLDSSTVSHNKAMVYKLAFFTRDSSTSSPKTFRTLNGEPYAQFVPKEKATNPSTEALMDFETIITNSWWNETDELKALRYEDYETIHFYSDSFEKVCKMFLASEKAYISEEDKKWYDGNYASTSAWYDFTTADATAIDEEYLIVNPISCKTSQDVPYFTVIKGNDYNPSLKDNQKEVLMSLDSPVFLQGGNDGTISNEEFEKLVVADMANYVDEDSEYQDLAINVESTFYDTGFTLATKKELVNFITLRKDTDIVLSTFVDGESTADELSLTTSRARAEALKTRYQMAPESEYFGTTVARGVVVMGSGKLRDGSTKNRVPMTYEIGLKAASMMGSSTGNWNSKNIFDNYPGNALEYLIDPQPSFIPASIKPTIWNEGVVWVQPYDRSSYHIPALQTIYEDDTSVLNNFFVMKALGQLTKLSDRVWRKFTGTSSLSNAEFIETVTEYCNKLLKGKFDNVVTVIPEVIIDDDDETRGYSWHIVWKLYGDNMKTVLVAHTEVYRSSDLTSAE